MTTFTAKTKDELQERKIEAMPGAEIIEANEDGLRYTGDGRLYTYEHNTHTMRQCMAPDYFRNVFGANARSYYGALILITARGGKLAPEDWQTCLARVCQLAGDRRPVLLATVANWGKATVRAHDGEPVEQAA